MSQNKFPEIAQYVILDVGIPTPINVFENVLIAVSNTLCMAQSRQIPAAGLAVINGFHQPIVNLTSIQTRLSLQKILHSISLVKSMIKCRARLSIEEFNDFVHFGIKLALEDFGKFLQTLNKENAFLTKLQVTIFSMKNENELLRHIKATLPLLFNRHHLFKIQVVKLVEDYLDPGFIKGGQCSNYLEHLQVAGTEKRLNELLKQWLIFSDTQEHTRLVVGDLMIWCDTRDCILRSDVPNETEHSSSTQEIKNGDGDQKEEEVLEVINRLKSEGICETNMFGDPVVLIPCQWQHHKMDGGYQAFVNNQQCFSELNTKLGIADEYLIAKYRRKSMPTRFFLIMPGEGFLLIKELVSAEMILSPPERSNVFCSQEVKSTVTTQLASVPPLMSYDPSEFPSGLYKHLMQEIQRPPPVQVKQEPLCRNPSHESIIVGVEVKKTTKRKKYSSKPSKRPTNDLPQLTNEDQLTLEKYFAHKNRKPEVNDPCIY